ncbi:hypothetical protein PPSIR1_19924 [Plesiocystis pacifica SIR-1]|uniref:Uncharacterized protein n=1 Tax=Plesiocystis pacifica SIR-1 TaxID=391625 RepID=A6GDT7_9BACT|nr:hypothetical protein [Plesiocystis pacifica]EDM75976.1 hypothetical protein PPSIR1_19924 [Plesiocystis pacifica SIR-1]
MRKLSAPIALILSLALPTSALAMSPTPTGPRAVVAPADEMSEEEKLEKAKELYVAAEGLAQDGNWTAAMPLYEQAYYLVPGKHGFAYKVGIASHKIDDCDKTYTYLTHFVTYATDEKYADKVAEANGILAELEERNCRTPEPEPEPEPEPVADENPLDNPLAEDSDTPGGGKDKDKEKKDNGLLVGGAVMLTIGVLAAGAGGAGFAVANSRVNELQSLSSLQTNTGFPVGDYSCPSGEPCPSDLEGQAQGMNVLGYVGVGLGGALVIGGAALIAVHVVKKNKKGGKSASTKSGAELTGLGPMMLPGGGGAAASLAF